MVQVGPNQCLEVLGGNSLYFKRRMIPPVTSLYHIWRISQRTMFLENPLEVLGVQGWWREIGSRDPKWLFSPGSSRNHPVSLSPLSCLPKCLPQMIFQLKMAPPQLLSGVATLRDRPKGIIVWKFQKHCGEAGLNGTGTRYFDRNIFDPSWYENQVSGHWELKLIVWQLDLKRRHRSSLVSALPSYHPSILVTPRVQEVT